MSRLTPDDSKINNGVLQVAHSIFKRWRPLYRSDGLFTEINHVLGKFGTPFLTLIDVGYHVQSVMSWTLIHEITEYRPLDPPKFHGQSGASTALCYIESDHQAAL